MKNILLFFYILILTIRPSETIPLFFGVSIFLVSAVGMLGVILVSLQEVRYTTELKFLFFFFLCVIASDITVGWFSGALSASIETLQLFVAFFSIVVIANCERKIKLVVYLFILIGLFFAVNSIIQHYYGVGFGGTTPVWDSSKLGGVFRAKYSGILNDPNDFGMIMLFILGLVISLIIHNRSIVSKLILCSIAILLLSGIYFTYSRGTYFGVAIVIIISLFYSSKKGQKYFFIGVICAALVPFLPSIISFLATSNTSDDSAGGRIIAWREGLAMLSYYPFFGVGFSRFTEFHSYTAHNSYVLIMAETGLAGLFGYMGFLYAMVARMHHTLRQETLTNNGLMLGIFSGLIGSLFCMFFLSRAYSPIIYLIFGLAGAALNVWGSSIKLERIGGKTFLLSLLFVLTIKILVMLSL